MDVRHCSQHSYVRESSTVHVNYRSVLACALASPRQLCAIRVSVPVCTRAVLAVSLTFHPSLLSLPLTLAFPSRPVPHFLTPRYWYFYQVSVTGWRPGFMGWAWLGPSAPPAHRVCRV